MQATDGLDFRKIFTFLMRLARKYIQNNSVKTLGDYRVMFTNSIQTAMFNGQYFMYNADSEIA